MAWRLEWSPRFEATFKKLKKQHRNECLNAVDNLDTYFQALAEGAKPAQLSPQGFVHNEREGAYAVDQTMQRDKSKPRRRVNTEVRLYVYPDEAAEVLYVIQIGGKGSQSRDVNEVHEFVRDIKADSEEK